MAKPGIKKNSKPTIRFEAVKIEPLFEVLDAIAWLDGPSSKEIAQFADIDPRTAGKILKNARLISLVESADDNSYVLAQPYPYKGTLEQKKNVVREALLRLPLIASIRQFMALGDNLQTAMRKAATLAGEHSYDKNNISPIISWANSFRVLELGIRVEALVESAVVAKQNRHAEYEQQRIAFISHSSKDKKFVRQLAADLVANGIQVWLDEQRIRVGDSIPEKVAQGLAESDFYLIVISNNSVQSAWVQKELNVALVREIERRHVAVLPIKIDDVKVPDSLIDKKYANFAESYLTGLNEVIDAIKSEKVTKNG